LLRGKNKTAISNTHTPVLAAILSDISDDSDTNKLLASERQQRKTVKKHNTKRNHSLFTNKLFGHVTKAAGIEVF